MKKIFNPSSQRAKRNRTGTRHRQTIIDNHSGEIEVVSRDGQGAGNRLCALPGFRDTAPGRYPPQSSTRIRPSPISPPRLDTHRDQFHDSNPNPSASRSHEFAMGSPADFDRCIQNFRFKYQHIRPPGCLPLVIHQPLPPSMFVVITDRLNGP